MFFSWYIKNRHFKQGNSFSGQIVPFLLVIIVVLLIAAVSVIQIGRVSIDKTATANAADAGSLAAASSWASALNSLTFDNVNLFSGFDLRKYLVNATLIPQANYYLALTALYVKASEKEAMVGAAFMAGGMLPIPCVELAAILAAEWYMTQAMMYTNKALSNLQSYLQLLYFIKLVTEECYNNQQQVYLDIKNRMDEAYRNAKKDGFRFAFMNSGVTSKLSKKQGDDFNLFLDKTIAAGVDAGQDTIQVDWKDKMGRIHTVSATLDLPNIESYMLWRSQLTYNEMQSLYDGIINKVNKSISKLNKAILELGITVVALGVAAIITAVICVLFCIPPFGTIAAEVMSAANTWTKVAIALGITAYISTVVAMFNTFEEDEASLENMVNNTLIDRSWDSGQLVGTAFIDKSTYLDVPATLTKEQFLAEVSGGPWSGLSEYLAITYPYGAMTLQDVMIIAIERVDLKPGKLWQAKLCTTQTHPVIDISSGATKNVVTTSCSSSKFDGGSMKMNFAMFPDPPHALDWLTNLAGSRTTLENVADVIEERNLTWEWYADTGWDPVVVPPTPEDIEKALRDSVDANYSPQIIATE